MSSAWLSADLRTAEVQPKALLPNLLLSVRDATWSKLPVSKSKATVARKNSLRARGRNLERNQDSKGEARPLHVDLREQQTPK